MEEIKLIAIDLDGTLLNDAKELSSANQEALQLAVDAGIQIVICTGRSLQGVEAYLNLLPQNQEDEYLIINNGATILQLPSQDLLVAHSLTDEVKQAAYTYYQSFQDHGLQLTAFDLDHYYLIDALEPSPGVQLESEILSMPIQFIDYASYLQRDLLKLVIIGETQQIDNYVDQMPRDLKEEANWLRSLDVLVEFLPQGVSKGQALAELSQSLNLQARQVMAIGDERNDIAMFEFAGLGVAMENAHPDLKSLAHYHTASNNQDGVAQIIQKLLSFVKE